MKVDIFNIGKRYQVIYADPPWSYRDKRNKHKRMCGGALSHYQTMDIESIKFLPVADIADDNSILFLWVTFPCLQEGLDVIKAWGFKYKTLGFSWIKTNKRDRKPFFGMKTDVARKMIVEVDRARLAYHRRFARYAPEILPINK